MNIKEIKVDDHDIRIEKYLHNKTGAPMILFIKQIRKKNILINEKVAKIGDRVYRDDIITMPYVEYSLKPPKKHLANIIKNNLLFEDDYIICINKPQIATQGGKNQPYSLDECAVAYHNEARIIHRLDKETTGVLCFAKSRYDAKLLCEAFYNREVKKYYLVKVATPMNSQIINTPIDEKTAITKFTYINDDFVLAEPFEGRKHQIRIHAEKYGVIHLHAWALMLYDYKFIAPTPLFNTSFIEDIIDKY
jgi:23S rRNA-/tRNA-specific pseudouridylate synthase